jgi:hypothetical protein
MLFQRQSKEEASLALHYLLAAPSADADRAASAALTSAAAPRESSELDTLPTGRDQVANSPGNIALLAGIKDRYEAARGFRVPARTATVGPRGRSPHRGGASATVIGQIRDLLSPLGTDTAS